MNSKSLNSPLDVMQALCDQDTNIIELLTPNFDDLSNPNTILEHVYKLATCNIATPHTQLLQKMIEQVEPVDYQLIAFPKVKRLKERMKELEPKLLGEGGSIIANIENESQRDEYKMISKELSKCKPQKKHLLIITIKKLKEIAEKNRWGLCKNKDFIYLYNGNYWAEVDGKEFEKFLGEVAEKMGVEEYDAKLYLFREALLKQFLALEYLPTPEPDKDKVLINLSNGTFEISTKFQGLRKFNRADFLTYQLPFNFDETKTAPKFQKYLDRALPDKSRQQVLAEYLGYVFIRNGSRALKAEKALILYGKGANGKSVFFEVVTAVFGAHNVSNFSLQNLTEEKGFYRAKIGTKLVNYASEIGTKLEPSLFKQMVSGEPVEACLKYGQPFTMEQYAKFIFNSNELPRDVEHTHAYFRRFLIIPFDVTIPDDEQDKDLHHKIIESELSGVFNWILEGLRRLLANGIFTHCEAADDILAKYKMESDSVQMFVNDNGYKPSIEHRIPLKSLYEEYKTYCIENSFKICTNKTFSDRLRNAGYDVSERSNAGKLVFAKKNLLYDRHFKHLQHE
jgi:putative DNA primase/helicase